jgi:hypothetical protein
MKYVLYTAYLSSREKGTIVLVLKRNVARVNLSILKMQFEIYNISTSLIVIDLFRSKSIVAVGVIFSL